MPPRSFQHWFRGASVEAASRTSTSTPWGGRGSLTAPVIRGNADNMVSAAANLRVGGTSGHVVNSSAAAVQQSALGGTPSLAVVIDQISIAGFEIIASADATVAHHQIPSGGFTTGGRAALRTSTTVGLGGGEFAGGSSAWRLSQVPAPSGGGAASGMASVTLAGTGDASGGASIGRASTIGLAHGLIGSGGASTGGVGGQVARPPGRSFKYWFRGGAVGGATPALRGDFARGFRGYLGLASAGKAGTPQVSASAAGGALLGGAASGTIHVHGRIAGAAAVRLGGSFNQVGQHPLIVSGGAARMGGACDSTLEASSKAFVRSTVGGAAGLQWTSSDGAIATFRAGGAASPHLQTAVDATLALGVGGAWLPIVALNSAACGTAESGGTATPNLEYGERSIVACNIGGGLDPRVDSRSAATVRLAAGTIALAHVGSVVRSASRAGFGASAQVTVVNTLVGSASPGVIVGGSAQRVATSTLVAGGGLGIGGSHRSPDFGIFYKIYCNDGQGGPIDYSSAIAQVPDLQWTSDVLPAGASLRFGVRSHDARSGLQEENLDASIALKLDDQGRDTTLAPLPPIGLRAIDLGGGRARIEWAVVGSPASRAPTRFHIYLAPEVVADFSSPRIVVPASVARGVGYSAEVHGLVDGRYGVIVRALNAHGEEDNVRSVFFTADGTPPSQVEDLAASTSASVA